MAIEKLMGAALRVPLFHGLQPQQMSEIVHRANRIIYQPGDMIFRQHEIGDAAILIVTGRATSISTHTGQHAYDAVAPGSLIGEMAMLIETEHLTTVVADDVVRALRFPRAVIQDLMAEDPDLADHFVRRIASRLNGLASEMRAIEAQMDETAPQPGAAARAALNLRPGATSQPSDVAHGQPVH